MSNFAFAKVHEFETTRLKSTAGTGVAGILSEEAAFLNPASLAFHESASLYLQRDMLQLKDSNGNIIQKPKSTGVVLSDGNPNLSGSISYTFQEEGVFKRKKWGIATSAPLSKESALGASLRKVKDENTSAKTSVDYYQTVFGVTHSIDPQTSLGVVVYDAFNSAAKETKAIVGAQHIFVDYITLMFDLGANYNSDEISDSLLYRGGIQVRVLNDFYLRFGAFNDKEKQEKGNGFGLAWDQPKISLGFALKNTKQEANTTLARAESKLRETSFSASFKF